MRRVPFYCALCLSLIAAGANAATLTSAGGSGSVAGSQRQPLVLASDRTRTSAPEADSDPFLFGDQAIEPTTVHRAAGRAEAFRFVNQSTGTASSLSVYVDSSSKARKLLVGLYSDSGGHPGSLLASGSLTALTAGSWDAVPFTSAPIQSGSAYWIVVLGGGGTLYFRAHTDGSCNSESSEQTDLRSLPSSWKSGIGGNTCPISAYVNGTLATPPSAPINSAPPAISGTAAVGQPLTTSNGSWTNSPSSYAYEWQDCDSAGSNCTNITGAIARSYTLASTDAGHTVRSVVSATNAAGKSAPARSSPTAAVILSTGFTLDPTFVGPSYYAKFEHGPSSSMSYFPICTYQTNLFENPAVVPPRMKNAGINCIDMAYDGGIQAGLTTADDYGMWENVNGGPSKLATFSADQSDVKSYGMQDAPEEETDPYNPGNGCSGPPTNATDTNPTDACAQAYINLADEYHSHDPTRPVWGNFSTGVEAYFYPSARYTAQQWQGHMESMVQSLDIVSGDSYFWTSPWEYSQSSASMGDFGTGNEGAWGYGRVQSRLRLLSGYRIPTYNIVDSTDSGDGSAQGGGGNGVTPPTNEDTPGMIESGVWDALVHGARGIVWWTTDFWDSSPGGDPDDKPYTDSNGKPVIYYGDQAVYADHQWDPQYAAMKNVDSEIDTYAPELNSPTVLHASASDDDGSIPVSTLAKDVGGKLWLVVMADGSNTYPMSNQSPMTATITVPGNVPVGTVLTVVGENRTVSVNAGHQFTDTFGTTTDGPSDVFCGCSVTYGYQHHIYAIP